MMRDRWMMGAISAAAMALVAGCGSRAPLSPEAGRQLPVAAVGSTQSQTAEQLTTPPAQARPGRSDELLKRSEERQDDEFDLPPT